MGSTPEVRGGPRVTWWVLLYVAIIAAVGLGCVAVWTYWAPGNQKSPDSADGSNSLPIKLSSEPTPYQLGRTKYPHDTIRLNPMLPAKWTGALPESTGTPQKKRESNLMDRWFRWTWVDFKPDDDFRQCLLARSVSPFGRHGPIRAHVEIASDIELRDAAAFLARDAGGKNYRPVYRQMLLDLPNKRTNSGTLYLDDTEAGEYLILILRVGIEKGGLKGRTHDQYQLTVTPRE